MKYKNAIYALTKKHIGRTVYALRTHPKPFFDEGLSVACIVDVRRVYATIDIKGHVKDYCRITGVSKRRHDGYQPEVTYQFFESKNDFDVHRNVQQLRADLVQYFKQYGAIKRLEDSKIIALYDVLKSDIIDMKDSEDE